MCLRKFESKFGKGSIMTLGEGGADLNIGVIPTGALPLDAGTNFRDLGGYRTDTGRRVGWGRLFRSGHTAALSGRDVVYLDGLDIRVCCDFRRQDEHHVEPPRLPATTRVVSITIDPGSSTSFFERLAEGGVDPAEMAAFMEDANVTARDVTNEIGGILTGLSEVSHSSQDVAASAEELGASSEELTASAETVTVETAGMMQILASIADKIKHMEETAENLSSLTVTNSKNAASMISELRRVKVMTPPDFVQAARNAISAHNAWVNGLKKAISGGSLNLERDPTRCSFGVFLSFVECPEIIPQDLWRNTLSMHEKIHSYGDKVEDALEQGNTGRANEAYLEAEAISRKLIDYMQQIIDICDQDSVNPSSRVLHIRP